MQRDLRTVGKSGTYDVNYDFFFSFFFPSCFFLFPHFSGLAKLLFVLFAGCLAVREIAQQTRQDGLW